VENTRGKATLLLACAQLSATLQRVEYFPAYEVLIDELRDYRFYQSDMVQPSPQAVAFIWERFCHTYFSEETREALRLVERIRKLAAHRAGPGADCKRIGQKGLALLKQLHGCAPELPAEELKQYFLEQL
jgi:hypothetical protein